MSWHDKVLEAILNAAKPTVEENIEGLIGNLLSIPQLRRLVEKNPDIIAAVISVAIGAIPEMDKRTVIGKLTAYGMDVVEILPRELVRAVKGQGTIRRDIRVGQQPDTKKDTTSILAKMPKMATAGSGSGSSILSKLPRR
ncbi:MAG: hypothetical protein AAB916_02985 [Patescibacteria group bacterium]